MSPILNASRFSIDDAQCAGPNMRSTMLGWMRPLTLGKVTQSTVDHQTMETYTQIRTMGVIQQLSAQQLALKPEGTRTWDWRMIDCTPDVVLTTEDVILLPRAGQVVRYRVMAVGDFTQNGFAHYEIVNDYAAAPR